MDEDHDELRFVCKLCYKRFPSGKSLGGHMRSHVITASAAANLSESNDKFEVIKKHSTLIINGNYNDNPNSNSTSNSNSNSNSCGLRENPKKSKWVSSSSTLPFSNDQICKQCGKGFKSLKALCGHMAFHSQKDKSLKDYDYSLTSENLDHEDKLIGDSHSDTEESQQQDPVCVTRSKSKNYIYGSSSVSEIDEFEQEQVAMCLMMLSKDSTNWAGVHSVLESSDNNSVVFETKFSSIDMKNSIKECNLDKNDTKTFLIEDSNYGYCRNGIKKLESDISVEGLVWNGMKGFNYKNLSYEEKQEIRKNLFREFGYDNSLNKRIQDDEGSYKRNKYECLNCNKTFSSFQGLGGHRPCHKKNNAFNSGGNSLKREFARDQKGKLEKKMRPKKNKGHECPICFRMFKSGQALGGHKRSHFINGSEDRIDHMTVMKNVVATYSDMFDLNLPAPEED